MKTTSLSWGLTWSCSLQPYGFGDLHWAIAHVLAFVGAFFGCLLVSSYNYEGVVTGDNEGEGKDIWGVSFLAEYMTIRKSLHALLKVCNWGCRLLVIGPAMCIPLGHEQMKVESWSVRHTHKYGHFTNFTSFFIVPTAVFLSWAWNVSLEGYCEVRSLRHTSFSCNSKLPHRCDTRFLNAVWAAYAPSNVYWGNGPPCPDRLPSSILQVSLLHQATFCKQIRKLRALGQVLTLWHPWRRSSTCIGWLKLFDPTVWSACFLRPNANLSDIFWSQAYYRMASILLWSQQ